MKSVIWSRKVINNKGFSLLETLIASTIFSSVLLVASTAFKFYMSMGNRTINSEDVMNEAISSIKIRNTIKGLHHYYVKSQAIGDKSTKLMFRGENYGFSGITRNGINFSGQPVNISVAIIELSDQVKNLVLCEFDSKISLPSIDINTRCNNPLIIAKNVKNVEFSYFGWSSVDILFGVVPTITLSNTKSKVWASTWSSDLRGLLPQYIKVDIEYSNKPQEYKPTQLWFKLADADPIQFKENNSNDF